MYFRLSICGRNLILDVPAKNPVKLVGTNYDLIVKEVSRLLDDEAYYISMAQANNPYGDGLACERIIEFIK